MFIFIKSMPMIDILDINGGSITLQILTKYLSYQNKKTT